MKQWNTGLTAGNHLEMQTSSVEYLRGYGVPMFVCIGDDTVNTGVKADKGFLGITI